MLLVPIRVMPDCLRSQICTKFCYLYDKFIQGHHPKTISYKHLHTFFSFFVTLQTWGEIKDNSQVDDFLEQLERFVNSLTTAQSQMVSKVQLCEHEQLESLLDSLKTPSDFQAAGKFLFCCLLLFLFCSVLFQFVLAYGRYPILYQWLFVFPFCNIFF